MEAVSNHTSMTSLIIWNISKAVDKDPDIDLKTALRIEQIRLEKGAADGKTVIPQDPQRRHLACALLAWQDLGHKDTDSLYNFIQSSWENQPHSSRLDSCQNANKNLTDEINDYLTKRASTFSKGINSSSFNSRDFFVGPVVKLPVQENIVMRMQNQCCQNPNTPKNKPSMGPKNVMEKIDKACCLETGCAERLAKVEAATTEIRMRAIRLAKREAERIEMLEKAEIAWRDLEAGYQRRLRRAEEKEQDLIKETKKLIEERKSYRVACTALANRLKGRGEAAEAEKGRLVELEQQMYEKACVRHRLNEEAAKLDAVLADDQCISNQLDRDLQFREEQTRCKVIALESELESARAITHEAERVIHSELTNLKDQIVRASEELLRRDAENKKHNEKLEILRQEKAALINHLGECQLKCEDKNKTNIENLKKKRQLLNEMKDKVMECRCKFPVDTAVEVKRTPSLAALCYCKPEDKILESCSCTSLRTRLLTDLFTHLFAGLQSELSGTSLEMPCQLLKCLEDKHNWDKSSAVKTNVEKFFSKLLMGELDIAIATAIETYHAQWVGASCADAARMIPDPGDEDNEGWQERAIERRAQKLATKLAEELFQQRANQLTKTAKDIVASAPPACECRPGASSAVFPCLVSPGKFGDLSFDSDSITGERSNYWRRTQNTFSQIQTQIEDLKKDVIKKQDLKTLQENIVKSVQELTETEKIGITKEETSSKAKFPRLGFNEYNNKLTPKLSQMGKRQYDPHIPRKNNKNSTLTIGTSEKQLRFNKTGPPSYAVNLCLCKNQQNLSKIIKQKVCPEPKSLTEDIVDGQELRSKLSSVKQTKPISNIRSQNLNEGSDKNLANACPTNCCCFHKPPSNTSIDKLLNTLAKWKTELGDPKDQNMDLKKDVSKRNSVSFTKSNDPSAKNESDINNLIEPKKSNNMASNPSQNSGKDAATDSADIPAATASEYIGEINLEKSNEGYCGCENARFKERQEKNNKTLNGVSTNKSTVSDHLETTPKDSFKSSSKSCLKKKCYESKAVPAINQISSNTDDDANRNNVSNDGDYNIKFLGVTITNEDSSAESNENIAKKDIGEEKKTCVSSSHCHCKEKLAKLRKDVSSGISGEMNNLNETQEGNKIDSNKIVEPVYCDCAENNEHEYQELEANTFELLEEHLKQKVENFNRSCKSTCIPKEKQVLLYSSILQRVKEVISNTANTQSCKCLGDTSTEGSWNRAYTLLQEYLKIKLKRAQCICESNVEEDGKKVLPDVLGKVCNLIENDFNKLKDRCQCKQSVSFDANETPERDTNKTMDVCFFTNNKYVDAVCDKASEVCICGPKETSNNISNKIISTQSISMQVPPYFGMANKCCDFGCERQSEIIQTTIETKDTESNISKTKTDNSCSCQCEHTNKQVLSYLEPYGDNSPIVYHYGDTNVNKGATVKEIVVREGKEDLDLITKTPYLGYTVECSCEGKISPCVCSKSILKSNDGKMNMIWKTFASNKMYENNMPYISQPNITECTLKNPNTNNRVSLTEIKYVCDTEITACDNDDNLALIESRSSSIVYENACTHIHSTLVFEDVRIDKVDIKPIFKLPNQSKFAKSDDDLYHQGIKSTSENEEFTVKVDRCDCHMVPICHIKTLIDNIETSLAQSKCTCDTMSSNVCPVHSKQCL